MQDINPILVGRNTPVADAGTPTITPAPAGLPPLMSQVAQAAPVVQQAEAPVVEQAVQAQPASSGCSLYFNIKPITKIEVELPWAFVSNTFDCVFVSSLGELVVCDLPPMYDKANDVFVLDQAAESLVLGRVAQQYLQYWRESVSFRPDSGFSDEDVKTIDSSVKVEEPVVEVKQQLEDTTDYSHLSRNQRKKIKQKKLSAGANLEDLPESLRNA